MDTYDHGGAGTAGGAGPARIQGQEAPGAAPPADAMDDFRNLSNPKDVALVQLEGSVNNASLPTFFSNPS